jgi:hypothetical protein
MRGRKHLFKCGLMCAAMLLSMKISMKSDAQPETQNTRSQVVQNAKNDLSDPPSASALAANNLDSDTRLNTLVSLSSGKMTMADTVRKLRVLAKVPLEIEGRQAGDYSIAFYFKDGRLADVLDSLAAVRDFTWMKTSSGQWVLWEPYNPRIWKIWPNNFMPEQIEIEGLGNQFLRLFRQLPKPVQTRLSDTKGAGIEFQELPVPMQKNIRAMMDLGEQAAVKRWNTDPKLQADPRIKGHVFHVAYFAYGPETKVIFRPKKEEMHTEMMPWHSISVTGSISSDAEDASLQGKKTSRMVGFFEYADNIVTSTAAPILLDHTEEDLASHQMAIAKDARMRRKYTLEIQNATFSEALLKLSALTHINFAAEFWNWNWETQSEGENRLISLREITLQEILDRLALEYHYSWSWRPSGVYVWHLAFKPYVWH